MIYLWCKDLLQTLLYGILCKYFIFYTLKHKFIFYKIYIRTSRMRENILNIITTRNAQSLVVVFTARTTTLLYLDFRVITYGVCSTRHVTSPGTPSVQSAPLLHYKYYNSMQCLQTVQQNVSYYVRV